MSMAMCACGAFVDTDFDCGFYHETLEDGTEVETNGKCASCRGE